MPVYSRTLKNGAKVYDVRVMVNGRRYSRCGLHSFKAATDWEKNLYKIKDGANPSLTVRDLAWLWLVDIFTRLAPRTFDDYLLQLRARVLPACGWFKVGEVRPGQLQALVNESAGQPRTAQKTTVVLKALFSKAVVWGLIEGSPAVHIKAPTRAKHERSFLTPDEAGRMLEVASGDIRLYIMLGLATGMRPGELYRLRWSDIDGRVIKVGKAKTAAGVRGVVLPGPLAEYLSGIMGNGWVFTLDGECWTADTLSWRFEQVVKRAGLTGRGITPHTLRHTYTAWLVSAGVPIKVVQKQLGHTDPGSHCGSTATWSRARRRKPLTRLTLYRDYTWSRESR